MWSWLDYQERIFKNHNNCDKVSVEELDFWIEKALSYDSSDWTKPLPYDDSDWAAEIEHAKKYHFENL